MLGGIALYIKVGEMIKAAREERKITLVDFASRVGISPGYLSQLENGRKSNPKLELVINIADELQLDIDMLLGLDNNTEISGARVPSLLKLILAKDRNAKVLEDRDILRKLCEIIDRALEAKYIIEDKNLYSLYLEDVYIQMETTLKRYLALDLLKQIK